MNQNINNEKYLSNIIIILEDFIFCVDISKYQFYLLKYNYL